MPQIIIECNSISDLRGAFRHERHGTTSLTVVQMELTEQQYRDFLSSVKTDILDRLDTTEVVDLCERHNIRIAHP